MLREVFTHFAALKGVDQVDFNLGSTKALSLAQWLAACQPMCSALHTFTRVEAIYCWQFSRMIVIDESSKRGARRMRHLGFEDFLEAVVRLSRVIPLPTDDEVDEEGCEGAAMYLAKLSVSGDDIEEFEETHQDPLRFQSPERCIAHTIDLLAASLPSRYKKTWRVAGGAAVVASSGEKEKSSGRDSKRDPSRESKRQSERKA